MKKTELIIGWILRILLGLGFLLGGVGKLSNGPGVIAQFEHWGYPQGFHFIVGGIEIIFFLLLMIPKTLKLTLGAIAVFLIGASLTHVFRDSLIQLIRPLVFYILTFGVYYLHFIRSKQRRDQAGPSSSRSLNSE